MGGGQEHEGVESERGTGTCAGPGECVGGGGTACPCPRLQSPLIVISPPEIEISSPDILSPEISSPEIAISAPPPSTIVPSADPAARDLGENAPFRSINLAAPRADLADLADSAALLAGLEALGGAAISPDLVPARDLGANASSLVARATGPLGASRNDKIAIRSAATSYECASPVALDQAHASDMRPRVSAPVFLESHPGGVAARSHEVAPDRDPAADTRDPPIGLIDNAAVYADMACPHAARHMACPHASRSMSMTGAPADAMGAPEDATTSASREREHAAQVKVYPANVSLASPLPLADEPDCVRVELPYRGRYVAPCEREECVQ